jgi:hypothetical protein
VNLNARLDIDNNNYLLIAGQNPTNSNDLAVRLHFYDYTTLTFIKSTDCPVINSTGINGNRYFYCYYNTYNKHYFVLVRDFSVRSYFIFSFFPDGTYKTNNRFNWFTVSYDRFAYIPSSNTFWYNNNSVHSFTLLAPQTVNYSFTAANLFEYDKKLYLYSAGSTLFGVPINIGVTCFLQGTQILRQNLETGDAEYVAVETLRKSDRIKTFSRGYIPIHSIGHSEIYNPGKSAKNENPLFIMRTDKCPELFEDLCITGNHCMLYTKLEGDLKSRVEAHMGEIYVSEGHYRVPACLDERSEPYEEEGPATIWHFALENDNIYENYGVFANGLLVESSSIRFMTELAGMELID